jgi:2-polyprenyl-6-methoxyphenol hydroxylase-like FAD-dependent oxidoreductase
VESDTRVLIAGGGVVGLSTALFLAHQGIPSLVVERSPGTSSHPGFRGLNPRTMEAFRSVGVEADIWAVAGEQQRAGFVARGRNLADPEISWLELPWDGGTDALSPCDFCTCDQDRLEPVLVEQARRRGATIRFGTELTIVEQDEDGVSATLRDRAAGTKHRVRADYLVAADGARGRTRDQLGIGQTGPGVLEHRVNVMFTTDVPPVLQGRKLTSVLASDINGSLVPRTESPWLMSVPYRPEDGESLADFTPERCLDLIRRGVGRADVAASIEAVLPWRPAALVADAFRGGRVFLAGDSAHVMPPAGAFGGNSGIHDAFNLAWKLAAVIDGTAGPALLDTYETERKPVIERTIAEALRRMRAWFATPGGDTEPPEPLDDNTVIYGYRYPVLGQPDLYEDPRHPTVRPGSRAPHVWLRDGMRRLSTLDLFGRGHVLLCGPGTADWHKAAARSGIPSHLVGPAGLSDEDGGWAERYGDVAVLVRPDGFVVWRSDTPADISAADPTGTLAADPTGTLASVVAGIRAGVPAAGSASR